MPTSTISRAASARPSARRRSASAGGLPRPEIVFEHLRGDEPTGAEWDAIFQFYSHTFERRGRPPYLNRDVLRGGRGDDAGERRDRARAISRRAHRRRDLLPRRRDAVRPLLGQSARTSTACISRRATTKASTTASASGCKSSSPARKASTRSAAASRRSATWSCHWLRDPEFHGAVADFLRRETRHVDAYMDELDEHVPYRDAAPTPRPSSVRAALNGTAAAR